MKPRLATRDAEAGRGVALRVEVDHQHPVAERRQRGAEVDRGGGLADAALLVGDGEDMRVGPGFRHVESLRSPLSPPWGRSGWDGSRWSKRQCAAASAISLCTVAPLGNKPIPPGRRCFSGMAEQRRRAAPARGRTRRRPPAAASASMRSAMDRRRQAGGADDGSRGTPPCAGRSRPGATCELGRLLGGEGGDDEAREAGAGAEVEPQRARRRGAAARAAPSRRSAGSRPSREARARDEVDPRRSTARAARGAPRAAPLFHVKHRRPLRRPPASRRVMRRRACACSWRARSRIRVSAAGVMPSIRAACARRLRPDRAQLAAQLGREAAASRA